MNVLVVAGMPTVSELAEGGVSRISVGGSLAYAAYGAAVAAGRELLESGTYGYSEAAATGAKAVRAAFNG